MFKFIELIKENGKPPWLIFGMFGCICFGSDIRLLEKISHIRRSYDIIVTYLNV